MTIILSEGAYQCLQPSNTSKLPVVAFGVYVAGRSQDQLVSSAKYQQWPADLYARPMVVKVLVPALLKAEPAVRLLRPFTVTILDKPGESFRKD
jgi:hypothetical protein